MTEENNPDDASKKQSNRELVNNLTRDCLRDHEVFVDTQNHPFIAINGSGAEVLDLENGDFQEWLTGDTLDFETGECIDSHSADEVVRRLISVAKRRKDGKEPKPLSVRIARVSSPDGKPLELWYDLRDEDGLAVHITKNGYTIEAPPPIFRRYDYQKEQVKPQTKMDGKWDDIFEIINLPNREDRVVFTIFAISCFVADFPKPILLIQGTNGSGKSTPCRLLHSLLDESDIVPGTALVKDTGELARQMNRFCLLHFDNIDNKEISSELSNALCRITSGEAFVKRALFTDDKDVVYKGQRPIIMNGIGNLVEKEDILDRSIIISMRRIPEDKRKTEAYIFSRFKEMKPYLLDKIFITLSKALAIYPAIHLKSSHRLADFEELGFAIAEALDGYSGKEWLEAYDRVVKRQVESAFEENPTAQIAKFLVDRSKFHIWEGTATNMHTFQFSEDDGYKLDKIDREIIRSIKEHPKWPKTPSALGVQLNQAESVLRSLGILVEHSTSEKGFFKNKARWITLKDYGWIKTNEKPQNKKDELDIIPF